MDFNTAEELLEICEKENKPISEIMRLREIIYGESDADAVDAKMKKSLDKRNCLCYNIIVPEWAYNEVWLSLVERYVRDVEAASSNLVTSTIKTKREACPLFLFLRLKFTDLSFANACVCRERAGSESVRNRHILPRV